MEFAIPILQIGVQLVEVFLLHRKRELDKDEMPSESVPKFKKALESAPFDAVVQELQNTIDWYRDIQKIFQNDTLRSAEETKKYQRKIGFILKKLSQTMLRGHVNLDAMRVWAKSAVFHIQMNYFMTTAKVQTFESLQIVVEIHQETARNLCEVYRKSNPGLCYLQTQEIQNEIQDASNWVKPFVSIGNNVNSSDDAGPSNQTIQAPRTDLVDRTSWYDKFEREQLESERQSKQDRERSRNEEACYGYEIEEEPLVMTFVQVQKKKNGEGVVAKQDYDEPHLNSVEGNHQLRRDRLNLEVRMQTRMDDLIAEQNKLTDQEIDNRMKLIIGTYFEFYELFTRDPEKLTEKTECFQRLFRLQLNKVKYSVQIGNNFLPRLKLWTDGGILDIKMTAFLGIKCGVGKYNSQKVTEQYEKDVNNIISRLNHSDVLPANIEEIIVMRDSFHEQLQEVGSYIAGANSSPLPLSHVQTDGKVNTTSLARTVTNQAARTDRCDLKSKQKNREEELEDEKKKMQREHFQREHEFHEKYIKWQRGQERLIEAGKEHWRKVEEDIRNGYAKTYKEDERQMEIAREQLAKEDEVLKRDHRDNERRVKEDCERLKRITAIYKREMK